MWQFLRQYGLMVIESKNLKKKKATFNVTVDFFLFNTERAIASLVTESVGAIVVHLVDLLNDGYWGRCGLCFDFNNFLFDYPATLR